MCRPDRPSHYADGRGRHQDAATLTGVGAAVDIAFQHLQAQPARCFSGMSEGITFASESASLRAAVRNAPVPHSR